ncbi:protein disulfide isomerase-like 5-2 [Typha angustifolia]|uniref:protein disulfide isomerase-like 5-2 n=1 Tax=Typha angustifolia TaxID=59011 RepID=UPI003C2F2E92
MELAESSDKEEEMLISSRHAKPFSASSLLWISAIVWSLSIGTIVSDEFPRDGSVVELDESNFDAAIAAFNFVLVDFYAPWCGHCKRLSPELDAAAPVLAKLNEPIAIAKINADKYRKLASKYEIDGFPTLKFFMHGIPVEYTGPRKSDLLVRFLKKFVSPDVSLLESDSAIRSFVESAGTSFPVFIGFGLNESVIAELASKFKKKAWFSVAKDFSEEIMVAYDFDKVPALVSLHPKYKEQNVFYGPFEGEYLGDFIRQNQLPLTVPISFETLKLLNDDGRKIIVTIVEDELDEKTLKLVKILRSAAAANRDFVFGYVGVKQWEEFADTFDITKSSMLPKMLVWDRNEEYHLVVGLESLEEEDQGSQVSHFLEGYREGRTISKKLIVPSLGGFIKSQMTINTVYLIVFMVAVFVLLVYLTSKSADNPQTRQNNIEPEVTYRPVAESESEMEGYLPGDKED